MLINRVHIYIFGILKHQGLIPCTRFWGVKRLPAEKVLKDTVRHHFSLLLSTLLNMYPKWHNEILDRHKMSSLLPLSLMFPLSITSLDFGLHKSCVWQKSQYFSSPLLI